MKRILFLVSEEDHKLLTSMKGELTWNKFLTNKLLVSNTINEGDGNIKKTTSPKKRDRERGIGDPGKDQDQIRRSDSEHSDPDPSNMGEKIEFIGGKSMPNINKSENGDESSCVCADCGTEINEGQKICPGCGKELDWEKGY